MIKVLKQALEDICGAKLCESNSMSSRQEMLRLMDSSITSLRQAIKELESQEPVAMYREKCADGKRCLHGCHTNEPCYTHPPQHTWAGLTDEDISSVIMKLQEMYHRPPIEIFARGIEAKLKEKNT